MAATDGRDSIIGAGAVVNPDPSGPEFAFCRRSAREVFMGDRRNIMRF